MGFDKFRLQTRTMRGQLDRRRFLKTFGTGAAALSMGFLKGCRKAAPLKPWTNFVIIFTDDQGYADLGCYGARGYETPVIDRMAKEGMRFTDFYVAQAVCSASRAALLTGCYPNRVSLLGALGPHAKVGLHPDEMTIAEVLKQKDYATGIFGKWHLGNHKPFLPLQQGFDEYLGLLYSNDMWPIDYDGELAPEGHNKATYPWPALMEGNEKVAEIRGFGDQDKLTTLYTERAVRFITKNKGRPFFLYVPHSMLHTPLGVSDKFRGKSEQGMYGDVMMEIDWSVGEILKTLEKYGLEENTLIIFTSDNGPWLNFGNHAGSAGPFREGKGTAWEGGVRVPCVMRWPGRVPAGTICRSITTTMDLLPTIASIAEVPLPPRKIDGVDVRGLLSGESGTDPRDHLYYYYGRQLRGVRQGKWKFVFPHSYRSYEGVAPGMDGNNGPYARGETGLALYDLEKDPGEKDNLIDLYPDIVERLESLGEKARHELGDTDREGSEIRACGRIEVPEDA